MKKEKWLVPTVVVVTTALLVFAVMSASAVYDYFFPMAAPIVCPNEEDIASISLTHNSDPSAVIEISDFGYILQSIRTAQPTRNWSVQDYPAAENYYTVEIKTSAAQDRCFRYFVYAEGSQVYLESPYEGVYKVDQQLLDLLKDSFKDQAN